MINFYWDNAIAFMKTKPDNYYDLATVDPPYGIGLVKTENGNLGLRTENKGNIDKKYMWDFERPTQEYFNELFRVSKNQIIWGGNYFIDLIKKQTSCFIIWDKKNGDSYYADAEIAWTSFETATRIFKKASQKKGRIHICQKPIDLYRFCLQKYAEEGQKILDTHGGSHTHAIACEIEGFDLDIIEISENHHNDGKKAYKDFIKQKRLF